MEDCNLRKFFQLQLKGRAPTLKARPNLLFSAPIEKGWGIQSSGLQDLACKVMPICHWSATSIFAQTSVPNNYSIALLNHQWNSSTHAKIYSINSIICHAQTVHAKTTQSAHAKTPAQVAHKYLLYASSASALGTVKECPHTLSCQLTSSIKDCHRAQSNQPQKLCPRSFTKPRNIEC